MKKSFSSIPHHRLTSLKTSFPSDFPRDIYTLAYHRLYAQLRPIASGPILLWEEPPLPQQQQGGQQRRREEARSVGVSNRSQRLGIVGSSFGDVVVLDLEKKRRVGGIEQRHERGGVRSVEWFGLDDGLFATCGGAGSRRRDDESLVLIWDAEVVSVVEEIPFTSDAVTSIAFSRCEAHSSLLAATFVSGSVRLIDLVSGSSAHEIRAHVGEVNCVAWSPRDENLLVTGGADRRVLLFDVRRTDSCVGALDEFAQSEAAGAVSHGIFSRGEKRSRLSRRRDAHVDVTAHSSSVHEVAFIENGRGLMTSTFDSMRAWRSGSSPWSFKRDFTSFRRVHTGAFVGPHLSTAESCGLIAVPLAFPNDHVVALMDWRNANVVAELPNHAPVTCVAIRDIEQEVIIGTRDGLIVIWTPSPHLFQLDSMQQ